MGDGFGMLGEEKGMGRRWGCRKATKKQHGVGLGVQSRRLLAGSIKGNSSWGGIRTSQFYALQRQRCLKEAISSG